jgi:outer membrane protein assembly factor BamB
MVKRRWLVALMLGAAGCLSACGYSLAGRGTFLPAYIKIIGVPPVLNKSTVIDLDVQLGDHVRAELAGHGQYTARPTIDGVDAILDLTITSVGITPVGFDTNRQATRESVAVTVSVKFTDVRKNTVIWSNPALTYTEEYPISSTTTIGDPTAFFGQDASALTRLVENLARSVVMSVLEAF